MLTPYHPENSHLAFKAQLRHPLLQEAPLPPISPNTLIIPAWGAPRGEVPDSKIRGDSLRAPARLQILACAGVLFQGLPCRPAEIRAGWREGN